LLTDEEPRGGAFRTLIALAILGIVGYLVLKNWDSPTFAAAIAQIKKTTQSGTGATEPKPQTQPSTEQPSISTDENAASPDAEKQSTGTATQDAAKPPSQDSSKKNDSAPGAPQEKSAVPPDTSANKSGNPANTKDEIASNKDPNKSGSAIPEDDRNGDKADTPDAKENEADTSKSPAPAAAGLPAQDLYERGQAYLSGHGAPQSCDQGVVYTRAAAQQGNPKAAVQMGALYATGRCVSQDRVQAYNWFNEALRNEPNNEYVERSRSTLWAQMTSEERQRAAKQ
jgi:TPR repeat protein